MRITLGSISKSFAVPSRFRTHMETFTVTVAVVSMTMLHCINESEAGMSKTKIISFSTNSLFPPHAEIAFPPLLFKNL